MNRRSIGMLVGLFIGIIWIGFGFFKLLLILLLGLIGWIVAAITGTSDDVTILKDKINSLLDTNILKK